jgi:hypothetical protein
LSVRLMADVWDNGPGDPTDCAVLLVLANFANERGQSCYPSMETIARMTRRSVRTVERSIASMETDGWIRVVTRGNGAGNVTAYVLNVTALKGRLSDRVSGDEKGVTVTGFEGEQQGRHGDGVRESERASSCHAKGDTVTKKGDTGAASIEEPRTEPKTEPGERASRNAPQNNPRGVGSDGEFMLATEILRECRLSTGHSEIRAVAEQIAYEAQERGGTLHAAEFIKTEALEAIARGEKVTIFWFKDRRFAVADVYDAFMAKGVA